MKWLSALTVRISQLTCISAHRGRDPLICRLRPEWRGGNGSAMLKYVAAIVVLVIGAALPTLAAAQAPYDNEQVIRMKQEADRLRTTDTQNAAPVQEQTTDTERS